MNPALERLQREATAHHLPFDAAWLAPLERVLDLLRRFGARTNLVGNVDADVVVDEHLIETLVAIHVAGRALALPPARVVDVGAGAGLEALLMAIAWPEAAVIAVEPRRRRADFIEIAADAAGVGRRVQVIRSELRAATFAPAALLTSRATFHISRWLELARPLLTADGVVLAHEAIAEGDHPERAGWTRCRHAPVPNGSGHGVSVWRPI